MRCAGVARELGISADWVRRAEREGKIPPVRRDLHGHRRFRPEDVERLRQILFPSMQQDKGNGA